MKFARNHMPISMLTRCGGATCDTSDWPMGERYSSPHVSRNVPNTSHRKLMRSVSPRPRVTRIIGRNEMPRIAHPMAILMMLDGSLPRLDCHPQNIFRNGVSAKMNMGLTAWNHVEGISQPNTCQSALRSANI